MPLHLLSKKSWNVYNPASIARVRADEELAKAREEAEEKRQDEYEAACRFAKLRGEPPPPPPAPLSPVEFQHGEKRQRSEPVDRGGHKRHRRNRGEDDTDRDIRVAREEAERASGHNDRRVIRDARDREDNITDQAGNIQLFAPPSTREIRAQKNAEAEAEKRQKKRDLEDQYTMRFSNAAGTRKDIKGAPWYAAATSQYSATEELDDKTLATYGDVASSGHDAFGREDPGRIARDANRRMTADPMTAIMAGQAKLKRKTEAVNQLNKEREHELRTLKLEEKEKRRSHGRDRRGREDRRSTDRQHRERHRYDSSRRKSSSRSF